MIMMIGLITVLSFFANMIGTVSGFGVGTIMTPILLLFLPFTETILLVCIIHWFHDIWKLVFFHHGIDWKLFIYFGLPTIFAAFIGALLVAPTQSMLLSSLLGLFLIGSVIVLMYLPTVAVTYTWLSGLIGGLLSGFFAGIFGIRGAVRSIFLVAYNLPKATFIGTTGAISLFLDSVRLITYFSRGLRLSTSLYWIFLLFIPASFFGAFCGQFIVHKIPQKHFRTVVAFFLLIVGIRLLLMPWF